MKNCPKCGSENSEDSIFCIICGIPLKQTKIDIIKPQSSIICPKCGIANPETALYCYDCGSSIKQMETPFSKICSTCGIRIDSYRLFCPNCGQKVLQDETIEKFPKIKTSTEHDSDERAICPACGHLSKGDYCNNCGYLLITHKKQKPMDHWYCPRDSAVMYEIDPDLQVPISRTNIDESIVDAMNKNLVPPYDREKAKFIAGQLLQEISTNFTVLARIQCPVCGQKSFAPATIRPKQMGRAMPLLNLNGGAILRSGYYYIRKYPGVLFISLITIIIDTILTILGINFSAFLDFTSLVSASGVPYINLPVLIPTTSENFFLFIVIGLILSSTLDTFFLCWYITAVLNIRNNNGNKLNLSKSLFNSFQVFPRAITAQIAILVSVFGLTFGLLFLAFNLLSNLFIGLSMESSAILIFMIIILILLVGALLGSLLLSILFNYAIQAIVFDDVGVIEGLKRSWRFSREYFWTTVGVIIIFSIASNIISYFLTPSYVLLGLTSLTFIISSILARLVQTYQTISFSWAYDTFKHTIV